MNHFISLDQAIQMTTRFRENRDKVIVQDLAGKNILPIAETFDRAAFDALLAQRGCERLRIYYGMREDQQVHAIIVGVDTEGQDMLPSSATPTNTTDLMLETGPAGEGDANVLVELAQRCPPDCGVTSPLNG